MQTAGFRAFLGQIRPRVEVFQTTELYLLRIFFSLSLSFPRISIFSSHSSTHAVQRLTLIFPASRILISCFHVSFNTPLSCIPTLLLSSSL